ncbi:MAG: DUF2867 domain-containing protein, partial [Roseicyclus sp.]|nr:DUF2867 domain-containing protein [Roseicyclus sp.]
MSNLERPPGPPDWSDTHEGPVRPELGTARAAYEAALGTLPPWVHGVMKIRNRVVGRFGLATPTMGQGLVGQGLVGQGLVGQGMMRQGMMDLPVVSETAEAYELGL